MILLHSFIFAALGVVSVHAKKDGLRPKIADHIIESRPKRAVSRPKRIDSADYAFRPKRTLLDLIENNIKLRERSNKSPKRTVVKDTENMMIRKVVMELLRNSAP